MGHRSRAGRIHGPLAGVPVAIKDLLCTEWGRTTCSSRYLEGFRAPYTATAVRRLEEAGAVILGKTNMDEFAMGSSTETCAWGPTRNPWDTDRVAGGSSGGSAVALHLVAEGHHWSHCPPRRRRTSRQSPFQIRALDKPKLKDIIPRTFYFGESNYVSCQPKRRGAA